MGGGAMTMRFRTVSGWVKIHNIRIYLHATASTHIPFTCMDIDPSINTSTTRQFFYKTTGMYWGIVEKRSSQVQRVFQLR
jgi:hypothetical protein